MKRMLLVFAALATAACTPETTAAPPTVTQTVTNSEKSDAEKKTAAEEADARPEEPSVLPCTSLHMEAAVAPGEWPNPQTWHSSVVVTNLGPNACSLGDASELRFFTGGNGHPLDVNLVMSDDGAPEGVPDGPIVLEAGDQASMLLLVPTSEQPTPDCLEGGGVVEVVLPDDEEPLTVNASVPPICGAVEVSPWGEGGAPGVAPN